MQETTLINGLNDKLSVDIEGKELPKKSFFSSFFGNVVFFFQSFFMGFIQPALDDPEVFAEWIRGYLDPNFMPYAQRLMLVIAKRDLPADTKKKAVAQYLDRAILHSGYLPETIKKIYESANEEWRQYFLFQIIKSAEEMLKFRGLIQKDKVTSQYILNGEADQIAALHVSIIEDSGLRSILDEVV